MPPIQTPHEPADRRGILIIALAEQFPGALTESSLTSRTKGIYLGDTRSWARDIAYLESRGLITRESIEVMGRTIVSFKLTPDGLLVSEGARTDDGVTIAQGE